MSVENGVMMQYFEWYLPENCSLWNQVAREAKRLAEKGITALWLPPAYKGYLGASEVGYAVYDLFDLGEFDQKGSVATKYGTADEYLKAIQACHDAGIDVYADIVLNHMVEGDKKQRVNVHEFDPNDRNVLISDDETIEAYTKFTFPGRQGKYDSFIWDKDCFTGSDIDVRTKKKSVYMFDGAKWSADVDNEYGNYDYLLGFDVNFNNPDVVSHLLDWGEWYVDRTGIDGFRIDAVKHIDSNFFPGWLEEMRDHRKSELFAVGEYWSGHLEKLQDYLAKTNNCMSLFDVPLHYAMKNISDSASLYDMSQIFSGTLTASDPMHSVTFVDNHDTQPGQALQSPVAEWFVPIAYALILLRREGYPCIFYGDYYGIEAREGRNSKDIIDRMLDVRRHCLYGEKHDYLDDFDVVGWTFEGDREHPDSGAAVILSDGDAGMKKMYVGTAHAKETWVDRSGKKDDAVVIDDEGYGEFRCEGGSVSFYTKRKASE